MTEGLKFIHSLGYLHKSLKPGNILISHDGSLKIADFDLTKSDYQKNARQPGCVAVSFPISLPAEVIQQMIDGVDVIFTEEGDVFALGCLFHCILSGGKHPFKHGDNSASMVFKRILDGDFKLHSLIEEHCARSLIEKMISIKPEERPSLDDILKAIETF